MRYVVNSAIVASPGAYDYRLISLEAAKQWLAKGDWISNVVYPEPAEALSDLTGVAVPIHRSKVVLMKPGDEALVFRLLFPSRFVAGHKQAITPEFIREHWEVGLLTKTE